MNRRLRSRLDLLHPQIQERVEKQQAKQKSDHDGSTPVRQFSVGDRIFVKNFPSNTPKWLPGIVRKVTGPLSYVVELLDGKTVRRHVDHVRKRDTTNPSEQPMIELPISGPDSDDVPAQSGDHQRELSVPDAQTLDDPPVDSPSDLSNDSQTDSTEPSRIEDTPVLPTHPRRSDRVRKPVVRYDVKVGEV